MIWIIYIVFLSFPMHISPTPLIHIIYEEHVQGRILTNGVLASETLVLTTKYPLSHYPLSLLCILPASNLRTVSKDYISTNCKRIKSVQSLHDINFALIELKSSINFHFQVNTAMIPLGFNATFEFCRIFHNKRNFSGEYRDDHVIGQEYPRAKILDSNKTIVRFNLEKALDFCENDNGLPVICDYFVVGLFDYERNRNLTMNRYEDCQMLSQVKFIKLSTEKIQEMLLKTKIYINQNCGGCAGSAFVE